MVQGADTFQKRTKRVIRRHRKMGENGTRTKLNRNGLLTIEPRRRAPRFPLRGFVILFLVAILYKAVMLAWLGDASYLDRLNELNNGTIAEQAGAWVLQIDPVTRAIADFVQPLIAGL